MRPPLASQGWGLFFLLLGLFLAALCIAGLIPGPGAWSDIRSDRLSPMLVAVISFLFLVFTVYLHFWARLLNGVQASLLCLVFGGLLVVAGHDFFESIMFL